MGNIVEIVFIHWRLTERDFQQFAKIRNKIRGDRKLHENIKKPCIFYIFFNASIKIWKAHTKRGFIYLAKEVRRRSGGGPVSVEVTVQRGVPGGEWLARLAGLAPGLAVGGEGGAPRGVHWHWEGPLHIKLRSCVFSSWQECFLPAINLVNNLS